MELSLNTRRHERFTIVAVGGEVDPCSGRHLVEYALDVMGERGPCLVVDLAEVTFMDSAGAEALLAIKTRAQVMGGRLRLECVPARVRRLLGIIGLDTALTLDDSGNGA